MSTDNPDQAAMAETAPPAGRSPVIRLVLRFVHRGGGRRRRNPVTRWLLVQSGRDPDRAGLAAPCRQCGEAASVRLLRLSPRRARYWCSRCGAVVTLTSRAALRLVTGRPAPAVPAPAVPAPAVPAPAVPAPAVPAPALDGRASTGTSTSTSTDGATGTSTSTGDGDAGQVMPAAMLRWVAARSRRPVGIDDLDKSTMYQLYKRWDAHLGGLAPAAVAELAVGGKPPPVPGLPAISAVVGALHDRCYRTDLVAGALLDPAREPDPGYRAALRERVEHARRWLATRAGELCWIASRLPPSGPVTPDRSDLEAAVAALRAGRQPEPGAGRAARAALFGTDGGPSLPTLQAVYPAEQMLVALEEYLDSGARPLRADVLAHLTAEHQTVP